MNLRNTMNHEHLASLTPEERADMKRAFVVFMDAHPVPVATPRTRSTRSPFSYQFLRIPAFALAIFALIGGTTYAAEQSLPNDVLYPFKTKVIEPVFIQGPARSSLAKAKAGQTLVERRLAEAEKLVDRNEVDAASVAVLAEALDDHARAIEEYVEEARDAGRLGEALTLGTDLENALEAHSEVLATIADDTTIPSEHVVDLIETIADQADEAEEDTESLEDIAVATSSPDTTAYITETQETVRTTITELRATIATAPTTEGELVREARALLEDSEQAEQSATQYLSEGKATAALPHLREALQRASQASILLESHEDLE